MFKSTSNYSCSGFLIANTIKNLLNLGVNTLVFQSEGTIVFSIFSITSGSVSYNHAWWMDVDRVRDAENGDRCRYPYIHQCMGIVKYTDPCHGEQPLAFKGC